MKLRYLFMGVFVIVAFIVVSAASANDCPSDPPHTAPPYVWHFDPHNPLGAWLLPPGPPPSSYSGTFSDNLVGTEWHVEMYFIWDPATTDSIYPVIINLPGQTIAGEFRMDTNNAYRFDIHIAETYETSPDWQWSVVNSKDNITFDMSVCEEASALSHSDVYPATWVEKTVEAVLAGPHLKVTIVQPVPTLSQWSLIALIVILLGTSVFIIRKRRLHTT